MSNKIIAWFFLSLHEKFLNVKSKHRDVWCKKESILAQKYKTAKKNGASQFKFEKHLNFSKKNLKFNLYNCLFAQLATL